MEEVLITAGVSLLTGWWIRRKSAELLGVRRANRQAQALKRAERQEKIARRPVSWEQIKKIG